MDRPLLRRQNETESGKLPVIFYIHGGGFLAGSGIYMNGKYFLDECVVFVSINYRLGALGNFLSIFETSVTYSIF